MTVLFWSYVHSDNTHDGKDLTWLSERLTGELRMQTGMVLDSFWDESVRLAADWQAQIEDALGSAALMIAIITPSYFRSSYCLAEYEFFRDREQAEGRALRIIPVYNVTTPELESPAEPWARDLGRPPRV